MSTWSNSKVVPGWVTVGLQVAYTIAVTMPWPSERFIFLPYILRIKVNIKLHVHEKYKLRRNSKILGRVKRNFSSSYWKEFLFWISAHKQLCASGGYLNHSRSYYYKLILCGIIRINKSRVHASWIHQTLLYSLKYMYVCIMPYTLKLLSIKRIWIIWYVCLEYPVSTFDTYLSK